MRETKLWTWHMLAGIMILILGGLHMVIMHMDGIIGIFNPEGMSAYDWESVVQRAQQVFFGVTYVLLLIVTTFHGFYGLRNILLETDWGDRHKGGITLTLQVFGAFLIIYGSWAAIASMSIS